MQILIMFLICC